LRGGRILTTTKNRQYGNLSVQRKDMNEALQILRGAGLGRTLRK
jgi:hypothetical protein